MDAVSLACLWSAELSDKGSLAYRAAHRLKPCKVHWFQTRETNRKGLTENGAYPNHRHPGRSL